MKKTILLSSLFAVGAAFATTVESGNAVGVLDKQIKTSDAKQILISVPFLGYDGGAVRVAEMVKTSNLDEGSKLYVPDGGKYNTWKLNESGQWEADKQVVIGTDGQPSEGQSDSQDDAAVNRGDAFWLEPKFKAGETTDTIFLLGQGVADDGQSRADHGWNLIGNASLKAVQLADLPGSSYDQIIVQVDGKLRYYSHNGTGWTYQNSTTGRRQPAGDDDKIQPGQGLWYKRTENSDKPIDWGKPSL